MVELQPSKLVAWVRFPSPAPFVLSRARVNILFERNRRTYGALLISVGATSNITQIHTRPKGLFFT